MPIDFEIKKGFGSDNHSGVHPNILAAIQSANQGHLPSYGTDPISLATLKEFESHFGSQDVFFVFNGTAANTLALKAMTNSYQAILCSDVSHVQLDECGAPEFHTGCKVIPIKSKNGKLSVTEIDKHLIRGGDQHFSQPAVLTLTQPTELGTLYSYAELQEFVDYCRNKKLLVHIDGARFSNAAAAMNRSFKELTADLGIDALSFGGTKNGLLFGEAIVFFNPNLSQNFKYIRKQGLQLPSKSRFVAAQFLIYLQNDLWKEIAHHSLDMAQLLKSELEEIPEVEITQDVQSNAIFAKIPKTWVKKLRRHYFFYIWDEKTFEARLMTTFDTTKEDIHAFIGLMKELRTAR